MLIPFEQQLGDVITHPIYRIDAHGGARIRRGRVGNALYLDGRSQYAVIENQEDSCMGNVQRLVWVGVKCTNLQNWIGGNECFGR